MGTATDVHYYFIFWSAFFYLAATKLDNDRGGHRNKRLHEKNEQHVLRLFFTCFSFLQLAKKERGARQDRRRVCDFIFYFYFDHHLISRYYPLKELGTDWQAGGCGSEGGLGG